jgi:hypothetical protein
MQIASDVLGSLALLVLEPVLRIVVELSNEPGHYK